MRLSTRLAAPAIALILAGPVLAADTHSADTHSYVVTLGRDTTSVETVTHLGSRVIVDQVGRAPRVMRRHFEYDYSGPDLSSFSMRVTPAGDTVATQLVSALTSPESLFVTTRTGGAAPRSSRLAFPGGAVVQAMSSPWSVYERETMRLMAGKADTLGGATYYLGSDGLNRYHLRRLGRDSVLITNTHDDVYHVSVDPAGHVLGVLPISGTGKFTVQRVTPLDLDALAASFAARDKAGAGLGVLSPRDTVRVENAGGAALWFDYGRPGKRGRTIFGNVVPYGEIWRTGANAATQFKTDKALSFGGTVVPAGFYTLWTLPATGGWKLFINSATGQWGTEHDVSKDIAAIDMTTAILPAEVERFTVSVTPSAGGGILNLDWDTTRASAAFSVSP